MKLLQSMLLAAALWAACAAPARAQVTGSLTLSTNAFGGLTTNAVTSTSVDCLRFDSIGLFVSATGLGPSLLTLRLDFGVSHNDTNYVSIPGHTLTMAMAGTNTAWGWTNLPCTGFRYLNVTNVVCLSTNTVTNVTVNWYFSHHQ